MSEHLTTDNTQQQLSGPKYWKSLDELTGKPEFRQWVEREFPMGASEIDGVNRRNFLKLMAASFGVAGMGLAGCRRPEQYIAPYGKSVERTIPGIPIYYATSYPEAKGNQPLVVETHQGRPTKIEGNDHVLDTGGATDRFAQASVLDLYDPDRARRSSSGTKDISPARVRDLLADINRQFAKVQGQGLAFLAEPSTSPTRDRLVAELKQKMPKAVWAEYSPCVYDYCEEAARELTGEKLRLKYNFKRAKRVLSLDADFLNAEPNAVQYARDFADSRRTLNGKDASPETQNRLYQVESQFSITGGMADHRLRLASSHIPAFAALVAAEVLEQSGGDKSLISELRKSAEGLKANNLENWIHECVRDLIHFETKSVVVVGSHQPKIVHQLAFLINDILKGKDYTVHYLRPQQQEAVSLESLSETIKAGRVETLVILGGNPAYDAPADLGFGDLLSSVKQVVRYGYYFDETSLLAGTHIAATHYLESWSDGRAYNGLYLPVQPMIQPLFEGVQQLEVIARILGVAEADPYKLVRATFDEITRDADKQTSWNNFLTNGLLGGTVWKSYEMQVKTVDIRKAVQASDLTPAVVNEGNLEVRFVPSNQVGDGRFNNNAWLQEMPDPMTKLTWDNAILIGPKLAQSLGYNTKTGKFLIDGVAKKAVNMSRGREYAPVFTLDIGSRKVTGPVHVQPGLADFTVVLATGYGRSRTGRIGKHAGNAVAKSGSLFCNLNAYSLMTSSNRALVVGAKLTDTGDEFVLANTQEHWSMEGRAIVRENTVEKFKADPHFVDHMGMESHSPPIYGKKEDESLQYKVTQQPRGNSAYTTPQFTGEQQWGMTIDLNTCTGCNACVIACQSENNIPIVGKDQVYRGREMHWIRLDRYYASGDPKANQDEIPADPQLVMQPMACTHCEMAPCEQVCPVNATVHDEEGLNTMAYNRCVGTRYCSNNCPYKVRRFNFFDYNKRTPEQFYLGPLGEKNTTYTELGKMQKNPDVTVRMRGVMEKCTYCQQRISQAKIHQKVKAGASADVKVPDGIIKTACQQVCPTESIVFGDVADAGTKVSQIKESDREYSVLGYLNIRPRTTYLARLRNPNPAMPDAYDIPLTKMEYQAKSGGSHGDQHDAAAPDAHGAGGYDGHDTDASPADAAHH